MNVAEQSRLYRRLATICLRIMEKGSSAAVRNSLADEADEICQQLGIPLVDRALLGKPAEQHQLEV